MSEALTQAGSARSPLEFRDPERGRALIDAIARFTEHRADDPVSIMHAAQAEARDRLLVAAADEIGRAHV